jgi:hypothetical protein
VALSEKAIQRLARLGYVTDAHLAFWRRLWQSESESLFWSFLEKEEGAAEEYRLWFPRLQAFAAASRQTLPVPAVETFSVVELEQYRILLTKMREFVASEDRRCVLERRPNQAAILSTTRVGLTAAQDVFKETGAILLLEEERDRWFSEEYSSDSEAFWWYAFAWWNVREGLAGEDEQSIMLHYPIPTSNSYWIVVSGVQWGDLAGGANHELWRWDGKRAQFIEVCRVDTY